MSCDTPTAAEFKALYLQFASVADATIELWFDQAECWFPAMVGGHQWANVAYYFAGHMMTCFAPTELTSDSSEDGLVKGTLTSEKVGDLARAYKDVYDNSTTNAAYQQFASTKYGQLLIALLTAFGKRQPRLIKAGSSVSSNITSARLRRGLL